MRSKCLPVSPPPGAPTRHPAKGARVIALAAVITLTLLNPLALRAQLVWEAVTSPTARTLWGVAWGNGLFVAVGDAGTLLTSPDGATWTPRSSGTARWLLAATYGGGRFVVVGDHGVILISPNGIDWTVETEPAPEVPNRRLNTVLATGEGYFAVGEPGVYAYRVAFNLDPVVSSTAPASSWLRGLALGHGLVVAVGRDGAFGYPFAGNRHISGLPVTQNAPYSSTGAASNVEAVVFTRDRFVAVGQGGVVLRSPDGRSWNAGSAGTTGHLLGLAHFDNSWVAVGDGGLIRTSDDGVTWTGRASPINRTLRSVAASATVAVAVGDGGALVRAAPPDPDPSAGGGFRGRRRHGDLRRRGRGGRAARVPVVP
jgi:hypothetical protein